MRRLANTSGTRRARANRMLSVFLGLVLALAGSVGTRSNVASAAPDSADERDARLKFRSAEAHFHAGQFAEALVDYQAGYEALPLPGFLVNMAQCQRRLGNLKEARASYQRFLLIAPDSPLGPDIKTLVDEINQALLEPDSADAQSRAISAAVDVKSLDAPAVQSTAALAVSATDASMGQREQPAARTRWWLWGGLAAAVVAGTVTAFALRSPDAVTLHDGSLGTLRR
jgi:tetratricopeptide (TPR) repeat protein